MEIYISVHTIHISITFIHKITVKFYSSQIYHKVHCHLVSFEHIDLYFTFHCIW